MSESLIVEAFERAIDGLQRKLNDAKAHTQIAQRKACRAYTKQLQAEIKSKCGDLLMLGLAAKYGGGSQSGLTAMGYFLAGVLTGNESQQPEHETILRLKGEVEQTLGIRDEQ